MKFESDPNFPMVCISNICKFSRECANHTTAGDFRTEDGFTPEITVVSGEVVCLTQDRAVSEAHTCGYGPFPENYGKLRAGFLTKETFLIETVQDYQI